MTKFNADINNAREGWVQVTISGDNAHLLTEEQIASSLSTLPIAVEGKALDEEQIAKLIWQHLPSKVAEEMTRDKHPPLFPQAEYTVATLSAKNFVEAIIDLVSPSSPGKDGGQEPFPQPSRKDGGEPCGECHIQPGETCDICGAESAVDYFARKRAEHSGLLEKKFEPISVYRYGTDLAARQEVEDVARCYVGEMKTTAGADYYVVVERDGRQLTPHMFKIRGRAEYEVAEWNWLLNGGEKPDILTFDTEAGPDGGPEVEAVGCPGENCEHFWEEAPCCNGWRPQPASTALVERLQMALERLITAIEREPVVGDLDYPHAHNDWLGWRKKILRPTASAAKAVLSASQSTSTTKAYRSCGGCGATDPSQRCIGCLHSFFDSDWPEQMSATTATFQEIPE